MSDLDGARRTWVMLNRAGTKGLHSSEIIKAKFPGCTNPSQRLREVADHVEVRKRRENIGRSPGIRAWLAEYAPEGTQPVTPHSAVQPNRTPESSSPIPSGSVTALNPARMSWTWDKHKGFHIAPTPSWYRGGQVEELRRAA